jgi:formylglycine-generating enzyme required for sulfatase activity
VFGVKHHEAIDYTNWLTVSSGLPITETSYWDVVNSDDANNRPIKKGKQGFRLPSETEWKFAARSGISTKYPFGADASLSVQYAWSRENSKAKSHQNVCQFRPNLGGLFDVNGNMQEWVQDPIREKEGNGFLKPQIFGGSFDYSVLHIDRGWEVSPTDSINDIGFRIVQSIHY